MQGNIINDSEPRENGQDGLIIYLNLHSHH